MIFFSFEKKWNFELFLPKELQKNIFKTYGVGPESPLALPPRKFPTAWLLLDYLSYCSQ